MTEEYKGGFGPVYESYMAKRTDAPFDFHHFAVPVICAAALGNRVWVETAWGRIFPAIWVCFIGRSSMRKSTAVNLACDLLTEALPEIEYPHDFSPEAFFGRLARQPAGLMRWREMGSTLENWGRRYMAGVSSSFTDYWDTPAKTIRELQDKERRKVIIQRPCISIIAAGKVAWFISNIQQRDLEGGFIGRWLFVYGGKKQGYRPPLGPKAVEDHEVRQSLVEYLRRLSKLNGAVDTTQIAGFLNEWAQKFEKEAAAASDRDRIDFAGRAVTHVLKLAMGIQAARSPKEALTLTVPTVEIAIQMFQVALYNAEQLVQEIEGAGWTHSMLTRLDGIMEECDGIITHRALSRKVSLTSDRLEKLIATQLDRGVWVLEQSHPERGGRPSKIYRKAK